MFQALKIWNMMITHQKMIDFASSIGFTTPRNIVERYSSKNRFKKVQIPKIPPWHKEGSTQVDHMGIFVFRGRVWRNFFEVIYLLTQQTQIVSGMMILDVSDLSKTNQAIFEVIESLKSNIYALDLEEFAQKKVNFKVFT